MTRRRAELLAWGMWALFLAMGIGSSIVTNLNRPEGFSLGNQVIFLPFLLFATVGAIVASRRPDNRIGWLYLTIGLLAAFTAIGEAVQEAQFPEQGLGRAGLELLWGLTNAAWYPTIALLATLAILWFPDGRPPTRRWRWVEIAVKASTIVITLSFALIPGP